MSINAISQVFASKTTKNSEENNEKFLTQMQDSPLFPFVEEGVNFGSKLREKFTNDQADDCNNLNKVDNKVNENDSLPYEPPMVKLGKALGEWVRGLFE